MSIVSNKELFRKGIFELNKPRQLFREWVCVLSDDAITSPISETEIATALGIDIGSKHPTYTGYRLRKITVTEGHGESPYHVHVAGEYGVILANELLSPVNRAAVWEFDSTGGEVPALYYYEGSGNGTLRPLTNSAYDYFPGLVTEESIVTIKITKNWASLPTSWIAAQNFVNDSTYLGCPAHSVKVRKVTVAQVEEEVGASIVPHWNAVAELAYRQSGHNYQLPDVGFNFLNGNVKQRCMVFDFENATWIPSPNPVGLNGSGAQTGGAPAILNRRVNPVAEFQTLFGSPPTTPLPLPV